jgi:hypothetical protein
MIRIKVGYGIALGLLAMLTMAPSTPQPVQFKIGAISWNTTNQEIVIPVAAALNTTTNSTEDVDFTLLASVRIDDASGALVTQLPPWRAAFEFDPAFNQPTQRSQFVPLLPIRVPWDRLEGAFVGEVTIIAMVHLRTTGGVTVSSQVRTQKGVLINEAGGS